MTPILWARLAPIVMLAMSNIFMTFAWYGHLKHKGAALWIAILTSWMIALPEYALAVPANRIGSAVWSTAQLKTIQEVITLTVFVIFSTVYLGEPIKWSTFVGFGFIALGAGFVFFGR
jgi:uncharacterized protein (DUF486 family)